MNADIINPKKVKLDLIRRRLVAYLEAERAILTGQEYEIEGLKLTRADLKVVRDTIADLEFELGQLESELNTRVRRVRFRHVIPRENF